MMMFKLNWPSSFYSFSILLNLSSFMSLSLSLFHPLSSLLHFILGTFFWCSRWEKRIGIKWDGEMEREDMKRERDKQSLNCHSLLILSLSTIFICGGKEGQKVGVAGAAADVKCAQQMMMTTMMILWYVCFSLPPFHCSVSDGSLLFYLREKITSENYLLFCLSFCYVHHYYTD